MVSPPPRAADLSAFPAILRLRGDIKAVDLSMVAKLGVGSYQCGGYSTEVSGAGGLTSLIALCVLLPRRGARAAAFVEESSESVEAASRTRRAESRERQATEQKHGEQAGDK